jgi:hypothetical protein
MAGGQSNADRTVGMSRVRFLRYDVRLELPWIEYALGEDVEKEFGCRLNEIDVLRMRRLSDPSITEDVYRLARIAARKQVKPEHWTGELATWCEGRSASAQARYLPPRAQEGERQQAISRTLSYVRSRLVRAANLTDV